MSTGAVQEFDVVIIGAGINGAGLFRDLCAQGLRVLLVDKGDFGSGTSAAPSRMIHGGLKYLETGEFRLVREAAYERNLLLQNAAHLVSPLATVIPIYSWTKGIWPAIRTFLGTPSRARSRGALLIKVGLMLYDRFGARDRQMPRHDMKARAASLAAIPALTPDIVASATYYDACIRGPERLVLELVQDAVALAPESVTLNWAAVTGHHDGVLTIEANGQAPMQVRPRLVVNAAGPWIDAVNAVLGLDTKMIGGTKGSHILLDHPELLAQLDGRMLYFEADDGRILLVFPYLGRVLVGTSDIRDDAPDDAACSDAETAYFMEELRDLLPGLTFDPDQIVFSYAGIRPLPYSEGMAPGLISRDHSAPEILAEDGRPFAVIAMVGGKWTTFRAFAAQVSQTVLSRLGATRIHKTDEMPIGGGRDMPEGAADRRAWIAAVAAESGASVDRVADLLARYGTTARAIAGAEGADFRGLVDAPDWGTAEIDWIARNERVVHLEDILLRRTGLAITGRVTPGLIDDIASLVAEALGWDKARKADERAALLQTLAARHGVRL